MLGELLGEEIGQTTGIRVLPSEGATLTVEVSFQRWRGAAPVRILRRDV